MYARVKENVRLRKEDFGVLIYSCASPHIDVISPAGAVLLTLLDGRLPLDQAAVVAEQLFQLVPGEGGGYLDNLTRRYDRYLDTTAGPMAAALRRYAPESFVYLPPLWSDGGVDVTRHRLSAPVTMTYIVTARCNFQCGYCYVNAQRGPSDDAVIAPGRIRDVFTEAAELGVAHLMVSGGEPLLHRGLLEALPAAVNGGIGIEFNTNGSLLADPGLADCLAATGLPRIVISIDAALPETQGRMSRVRPEAHGEMLRGIANCLSRGIHVKTNSILCADNIREIPALTKLLADMGVNEMAFSHYTGSFQNRNERLFPSLEDYEWLADEMPRLRRDHPDVTFESGDLASIIHDLREGVSPGPSRCDSIKRGLIILPDGRATFCDTLADARNFLLGDLRTQTIGQVWASPRYEEFLNPGRARFAGTACEACELFDACVGNGHCYARALMRYGTGYAPDPFCPVVYDANYRLF